MLHTAGGKLAAWAPAGYLANKAGGNELAAVRGELAPALDMVRGPEYEAKVRHTGMRSPFFPSFTFFS